MKYINPLESQLFDAASGIHVRFRLGGNEFPPSIYYKIFTHSALIDLNSFAPRDYTQASSKLIHPRERFNKPSDTWIDPLDNAEHVKEQHEGWYKRIENNGWRLVSQNIWFEDEAQGGENIAALCSFIGVTKQQQPNRHSFHHDKLKRHEEVLKRRKLKKIEWMKKMYRGVHETLDHAKQTQKVLDEDEEDEFLLSWSKALDFNAYMHSWTTLATTGLSEHLRNEFELQPIIRANSAVGRLEALKGGTEDAFLKSIDSARGQRRSRSELKLHEEPKLPEKDEESVEVDPDLEYKEMPVFDSDSDDE